MSFESNNIKEFVNYFSSGKKCKECDKLGLELEHFVVNKEDRKSVSYYGEKGIETILKKLSKFYDEEIILNSHLIGLSKDKATVTLEPAGQLEISIGPYKEIEEIRKEYDYFIENLYPILDEYEYSLVNEGYHPLSKVDDLKLIPKTRYEFMDKYFKQVGSRGKNMMKGSASTQVSIDYDSQEDFSLKFRLANILGPLFAYLTDNSPIFEGEIYKENMLRTFIWNDVDNDRSKVVPGCLNKEFGFNDYASYVYNSPGVLILDEKDSPIFTGGTPIKELYKDKSISKKEIEHLLSMFFPDVRLKTYVEIRMADSLPIEYALSYAALIKGIFYNEKNLKYFINLTKDVTDKDVKKAKEALMEKGFDSTIYKMSTYDLSLDLIKKAQKGLNKEEAKHLAYLEEIITSKETLAKRKKEKLLEGN